MYNHNTIHELLMINTIINSKEEKRALQIVSLEVPHILSAGVYSDIVYGIVYKYKI